ncbi:BOD1/SHG1 domain-containing protein [Caenorhabditis elegans]|nr:Trigger_C domain-containing protein [Caenorhabditis elegans]CAA97794.1 Trigger_C domain-containing protein [Caenorhabditis elegans]|eukprot:NP_502184.1 Uncharacterized protein CELE_F40F11.3 [Caenorhabditis elegans]
MSCPYIDEDKIVGNVEMELKKGGTFDKLRKQAIEHVKDSKLVHRIENEMLVKVDEIIASSANLTQEEIQRKMKDFMNENAKMRNDINRQIRVEFEKEWVHDELDKEIDEKVNKQLENSI